MSAEYHPEHDRTSCSDAHPINADAEGSTGCARCTALAMDRGAQAEAALLELVATKQMREEVSRRKQRRLVSIKRDKDESAAVARLHQECKVREARAWAVARSLVGSSS